MADKKTDKKIRFGAVIGLEVHAQMRTETKLFCGCSTRFGAAPNTQTCPVCTGQPGSLPVLNDRALEFAVRTGLAMHCRISSFSRFARKNYFYPDLPKGYQISQYELPICEEGWVEIIGEKGEPRKIGITRIHMEDDAGKNIHETGGSTSLVDLNRCGVPLMEIVSEPDLRTPAEAADYMRSLRTTLRYIGVCDGNMEQGSLRCDANVSLRPLGTEEFGTKVEIKNINSFRFVEKALEYEIKRQAAALRAGETIVQETRLWDPGQGVTRSMRSKEEAHDYRYFPDPDLVPIKVPRERVEELRASLPELPEEKRRRFVEEMELPQADALQLSDERPVAEWFERVVAAGAKPKSAANWIMGELTRKLNETGEDIEEIKTDPEALAELISLIEDGTISGKMAKEIFEKMYESGRGAKDIVEKDGYVQITDTSELEQTIDEILAASPDEVERYRGGEQKLMGFFVGQIMKRTQGKANPKAVQELLKKKLEG